MRREVMSAPLVNALTLRLFSGGNQASARPQLRATAEIAEIVKFSFPKPKRLCGLCVRGLPTLRRTRSAARHGADDEKRLFALGDARRQQPVGRLVRPVFLAREEAEERPPLPRHVIAN